MILLIRRHGQFLVILLIRRHAENDDGDEDSLLTGAGMTPNLFVAPHSANVFPSGQQALISSVQYEPISQITIFWWVGWLINLETDKT